MSKPVTLEQVEHEERRVQEVLDGLLQPLRAAKDSVKVAKAAGTKEELQSAWAGIWT